MELNLAELICISNAIEESIDREHEKLIVIMETKKFSISILVQTPDSDEVRALKMSLFDKIMEELNTGINSDSVDWGRKFKV